MFTKIIPVKCNIQIINGRKDPEKGFGLVKRLNLDTIKMKTCWTIMMFGFYLRTQIYDLRPPLLIYAYRTGVETSEYL